MKKIIAITVFTIAMAANSAFATRLTADNNETTIWVTCAEGPCPAGSPLTVTMVTPGGNEICVEYTIPETIYQGSTKSFTVVTQTRYPGYKIVGVKCDQTRY